MKEQNAALAKPALDMLWIAEEFSINYPGYSSRIAGC